MNDNKKLFAFFLHKGALYFWSETSSNGKLQKLLNTTSLDFVEATSTEFFLKNREVDPEDESETILVVHKITILFSTFRADVAYREPHNDRLKMKGMAIDT